MGPIRSSLVLSAAALIGALSPMTSPLQAAEATEEKGAKIYCFMRSSGNDHEVSWNAAYAVIKRQRSGVFKTSCLLYTSPSPRDKRQPRMPSSA